MRPSFILRIKLIPLICTQRCRCLCHSFHTQCAYSIICIVFSFAHTSASVDNVHRPAFLVMTNVYHLFHNLTFLKTYATIFTIIGSAFRYRCVTLYTCVAWFAGAHWGTFFIYFTCTGLSTKVITHINFTMGSSPASITAAKTKSCNGKR